MSFFKDMIAVFKKRELSFLESYKESEGVYTFLFEKPDDFTWKAGQHGLFSITHKKIKNATRPFTVASAPAENVVRLSMRINDNPSDFKQAMLELNQGMKVSMSGPVGPFYLENKSPTILIAGGIGITPFRSILKQIEAEGNLHENPIHLLYLDSDKSYIFKDELDEIANNPAIHVTYLDARDDLHQEIDTFSDLYKNDGKYFIAGPKSMVESISSHLRNMDVPKRNIKKDAFFGY
ncbi:FAD-dependent oxidoreductase [Oceanobacillus polygoni]|uniref:Ferredoxin-NADP reductase n=1 Tax=Oceanobacillus polygoni TaxID=1235259 RepID=A0A9X0YV12_9BACI|nr:FAD-dependent oxidoreductase [Oceanobacillus polygoni]MBP2079144.1 ferredoxin-NADP reductase [Oceanobacillus polygoni]